MNRSYASLLMVLLLTACRSDGLKTIDLNVFKVTVPSNWRYEKLRSIDSFGGMIISLRDTFYFDYSSQGSADSLIQTEQDYLKHYYWYKGYFEKPGIIYTNNSKVTIDGVRKDEMKKRGIKDTSLVKVDGFPQNDMKKVFHRPTEQQHEQFPKADYIADLTYKDSSIIVPIEIPAEIKAQYVRSDTDRNVIIKTTYPKITGNGLTGVYIHSRSPNLISK